MIELLFWRGSLRNSRHWEYYENRQHRGNFIFTRNILDRLWQQINRSPATWTVIKDGDTLVLTTDLQVVTCADGTILFSASPREIVMQLRPYMALMESQ